MKRWVIVHQTSVSGQRIYGPYETAAKATGAAFSRFGANPSHTSWVWWIRELETL